MIGRFFRAVYEWMARLGLVMKDDDPLEVRDPDRQWGPPAGSLVISAKAKGRRLSVVLKNTGTEEIRAEIPAWLFFYQLDISGSPPLSTFGEQTLDPGRSQRRTDLILQPGKPIEAEIPVDTLYDLGSAPHRVKVSCDLAGVTVVSNEVTIG
jgi:hypothetical protein